MTVHEVAALFPGGKWSHEEYRTLCRAHEDRNPSLSIKEGESGGVVLHCHAGCAPVDVLGAVGLTWKDVAPASRNGSAAEFVASYRYDNEQGGAIATKHRKANKEFVWQQASGEWNLKGVSVPLYRVPALLRAPPGEPIAIVEGEKDAENVAQRGIAATTNPDGAAKAGQRSKWKPEYTAWLKENLPDREFLVFADQDEAGLAHAEAVVESLKAAGLNVRAVSLPGIKSGEDISDWLGRHTAAEFEELLKTPVHPLDLKVLDGESLEKADLPTPDALIPHLLYRGFVTLLAGDSKLGKSSLELRGILAACAGGWWLDRDRRAENRLPESRVLYVNFEDPLFVTRDRARKMMAPERMPKSFLTMPPPYGVTLAEFLDWLHGAHQRLKIDAVVLDPIAVAAEWADETDNAEVARTLKPMARLAAETMLAILLAHHVTKKPGQFGLNIRGASAIKANVLGYLVLEREKELFKLSGINKLSGNWDVTLDRTERDWSWWIVETRAGHTRTAQQAAKERALADLLALISAAPLVTTEGLVEQTGIAERTCRRYLAELKENELILAQELPASAKGGNKEIGWILYAPGTE